MYKLPMGTKDFSIIRTNKYMYVDKTYKLIQLIENGRKYFLSCPSGFGKTLTTSTLKELFSGENELFNGLFAENWIFENLKDRYPVINFDFSTLNTKNYESFEKSLLNRILTIAKKFCIKIPTDNFEYSLNFLLNEICDSMGSLVIFVDNFEKVIVNCIRNNKLLFEISNTIKLFYNIIDSFDANIRFLMIVGEEKYNRTGIFSILENIDDITSNEKYSDLLGFTQEEVENNFSYWIEENAKKIGCSRYLYLERLRKYCNDFHVDCGINIYNSLALLRTLSGGDPEIYSNCVVENVRYSGKFYLFINQGDTDFNNLLNYNEYIDKSELLIYTNNFIKTNQKYICISRPRRFGKTIAANMVASYYDISGRAKNVFKNLKIAKDSSFQLHANKYIVVKINIQNILSQSSSATSLIGKIKDVLSNDLKMQYCEECYSDDINTFLKNVYEKMGNYFVFVIDEWDCILREYKDNTEWQKEYLDFLRYLFKDQSHIALVYMTGILPIKKYGTHSALNMFNEYSMVNADVFAEFVGFTEEEVKGLCLKYRRDFGECKKWYDGYQIETFKSVYNPRSVIQYAISGKLSTYWNSTETYEALKIYITMEKFGLHDAIIKLLANEKISINTSKFTNDMKTFNSMDDILTLLVHLGYLSFNSKTSSVRISNKEISCEFVNAIQDGGWPIVVKAIENSKNLLNSVFKCDCSAVARGIEEAHMETSHLQYNDENALAYTIALAFYAAREQYTVVREFPTGKGFADLLFLPRQGFSVPILLIELKWNSSVNTAIDQIRQRNYPASLADRGEEVLLIGISYDKKTKKHTCTIESFQLR